MHLTCGEELLRGKVKEKFGRTVTIGRCAILTKDLNGRPKCHYCGPCSRGCTTGSYYSSPASTLPAAEKTGRLTLIPNAVVSHIEVDGDGKCRSVQYVDRLTRNHREAFGKVVVLCASTLESARIMLNSRSARYGNGIANSSGVLGHYVMDHVTGGGASGVLPMLNGVPDSRGNRPNGIYIPRFRNITDKSPGFIRGYGFQGSAELSKWGHANYLPGFGAAFKKSVRQQQPWFIYIGGFGECLPRFENYVEIDKEKRDDWGIPVLHINVAYGDNEKKLVADMADTAGEELVAVASRAPARAAASAREWGIPRSFGGYEDMLADDGIDVVYIPLPNALHAEWTIRAMRAGKHVLCEKPLAVSMDEVDAIAEAARQAGVVVAEGLMYRHHALTREVKAIVERGTLGELRVVRGCFTFPLTRENDVRLDPALGGGCLWDLGVYPTRYARLMTGTEPLEAFGWQTLGPTGVDVDFAAQLRFPANVVLQCDTGFRAAFRRDVEIVGSEASLFVPNPFNPGPSEPVH